MHGENETNRQQSANRATLARVEFVEKLHELNAIQSAISASEGTVSAMYDEIETFLDARLQKVRNARKAIRNREKHSRRLTKHLAELLPQVLGD